MRKSTFIANLFFAFTLLLPLNIFAFFGSDKKPLGLYDITTSTKIEDFIDTGFSKDFEVQFVSNFIPEEYSEYIQRLMQLDSPLDLQEKLFVVDFPEIQEESGILSNTYKDIPILPDIKDDYLNYTKKLEKVLSINNHSDNLLKNKIFPITLYKKNSKGNYEGLYIQTVYFKDDDSEDFKMPYFLIYDLSHGNDKIISEAVDVLTERYGKPDMGKKYDTAGKHTRRIIYWEQGKDIALSVLQQSKSKGYEDVKDYSRLIFYNEKIMQKYINFINENYNKITEEKAQQDSAAKNKAEEIERSKKRSGM